MNTNTIVAGILLLLLFYVHILREAFHAEGRRYLRAMVEGIPVKETGLLANSGAQVRATLALRLARITALVLWVLAVARLLAPQTTPWAFWVGGLVAGVLADMVGRLLGEWIAARFDRARTLFLRQVRPLVWLMLPWVWLYQLVSKAVLGIVPARDTMLALDEEQILIMARHSNAPPMQAAEKTLIDNIFDFRETIVREIMIPRLDIIAVPVETSVKDALDIIIKHGHSRIPVYEKTIDQIVGILYAKDILRYMRESYPQWPTAPLRAMLRPPYYVPDSKRVSELLPEMQQNKIHMAIVVDEYGGTAGIVTIEDVLEEIVGEIQDEYDRELPEMQQVGENEYIMNARVDLEDVSDFIGVDLPDNEADTLGGFVYMLLNRMPHVGDVVEYPPVRIQVLSVDGRRIGLVRVSVHRDGTSPAEEEVSQRVNDS